MLECVLQFYFEREGLSHLSKEVLVVKFESFSLIKPGGTGVST